MDFHFNYLFEFYHMTQKKILPFIYLLYYYLAYDQFIPFLSLIIYINNYLFDCEIGMFIIISRS